METTDSTDKQIVQAIGIPRGCMSFPQGPPLHLLSLEADLEQNRLFLDVT